jgi:hypothetical protein
VIVDTQRHLGELLSNICADGILTVSDDLLKNDGRRFINMMEQLAERRLQREEDRQYGMTAAHQAFAEGEYEDDEEDNGAYESEEDEDFEDDDMVCLPGIIHIV